MRSGFRGCPALLALMRPAAMRFDETDCGEAGLPELGNGAVMLLVGARVLKIVFPWTNEQIGHTGD